jgi:hypothetical protein
VKTGVDLIGIVITAIIKNYDLLFFYNININKMNSLLIILIIVLLFYVCQCAKEQFDNSLYLGYGGEPQFRDMTEGYGGSSQYMTDEDKNKPTELHHGTSSIYSYEETKKRLNEMRKRRDEDARNGSWKECRRLKSFGWCLKNRKI